MFDRNHRGSYIGWPQKGRRREQKKSPQRKKYATKVKHKKDTNDTVSSNLPQPMMSEAPSADPMLQNAIDDESQFRTESLNHIIELRQQIQNQVKHILALQKELGNARHIIHRLGSSVENGNVKSSQLPDASASLPDPCTKSKVSRTGKIILSKSTLNLECADIHILLNNTTFPLWQARPTTLGRIIAKVVLSKANLDIKEQHQETRSVQLTIACITGSEAADAIRQIYDQKSSSTDSIPIVRVCDGTVLHVDLDKHAVKYLVDAKLGNSELAEQTFREAGAVLLDMIDSCLLQTGDYFSYTREAHPTYLVGRTPTNQGDDFFFC